MSSNTPCGTAPKKDTLSSKPCGLPSQHQHAHHAQSKKKTRANRTNKQLVRQFIRKEYPPLMNILVLNTNEYLRELSNTMYGYCGLPQFRTHVFGRMITFPIIIRREFNQQCEDSIKKACAQVGPAVWNMLTEWSKCVKNQTETTCYTKLYALTEAWMNNMISLLHENTVRWLSTRTHPHNINCVYKHILARITT